MHLENLFIQVEVENKYMDITFKEFTDYLLKEETWIQLGVFCIKVFLFYY